MATSHMRMSNHSASKSGQVVMTENVPEKPLIPLVAHVITDDDIGLLQVCILNSLEYSCLIP